MTDEITVVAEQSAAVDVIEVSRDGIFIVADSSTDSVEIVENVGQPIEIVDQTGGYGIDGHPVVISNPQVGDVISYTGAVFANRSQEDLTDGGNF